MGKQFDGVRPASESSIEIDFYYAGQRCRERVRLKPSPANLKRASNHRAAVLDAIERGTFNYGETFPKSKSARKFAPVDTPKQRLQEFLEAWIDSKSPTIKASTAEGYKKIVNGVLVPKLGSKSLQELSKADVRSMCVGIEASNKRITNILSVLRSALTEAAEDQLIEINPIAGWSYSRNEAPKESEDIDPFTQAEQSAILKALDGQARNLIQFAFWTGMRTSELVGLKWDDVDLIRAEARIKRAVTQASKNTPETPKTFSSKRSVKLLRPALQALEAQRAFTQLSQDGHVFHNPRTSKPWTGDQPIRKTMWQPALQRAKVRYRYPYQTRHTFASMTLSAGEHPMWVANQLGHSDWGMIRKTYGRWMPDAAIDAGSKVEAQYAGLAATERRQNFS